MARRKSNRIDSRAVGLDIALAAARFLTGRENLHYGLWEGGLEVNAGNLGRAQEAYTERLFAFAGLDDGRPRRVLDIGGGAGETARKLLALGHEVDIVIPSQVLAERCRENAPAARVHECLFEAFESDRRFDVCLFSESFQYIPPEIALEKAAGLLDKGGEIVISDCFRSPGYRKENDEVVVGGGHRIARYRDAVEALGLKVLAEEDVTEAVAPSVEIEQDFYNVLGFTLSRIDRELREKKPWLRRSLAALVRLFIDERRRRRLDQRLNQRTRTAEAFRRNNIYLMTRLRPGGQADAGAGGVAKSPNAF